MGGGMVDEKIGFIATPYSVVWIWGNTTREARREPGFLEGRTYIVENLEWQNCRMNEGSCQPT